MFVVFEVDYLDYGNKVKLEKNANSIIIILED